MKANNEPKANMKTKNLPTVNQDRTISFDGIKDDRYTFPVWSWMSNRGMRIYFDDKNGNQATIGGKFFGEIEVLLAAASHRESIN